jgi:diol dehydratase reactivase alpha subunit
MLGAATTPGAGETPFVIDLGGGTVDLHHEGSAVVLAGAGALVTRICGGLLDAPFPLAERAKRVASARVETPFVLHHEDGTRTFLGEPAPPQTVARLCLVEPDGLHPLRAPLTPEVWRGLRREAKRAVLAANARRAIDAAGGVPAGELVVLAGGCAVDQETVEEIAAALADLEIAVARADVLGRHGPRAAVAVGLVRAAAGRA